MTDATTSAASFASINRITRKKMHLSRTRRKKRPTAISTSRDKMFRTQYYFTKGHEHMGEARNVNEEQSPFVVPSCSLMFAYFQYWQAWNRKAGMEKRGASYQEQHNYKTLQARDILQRLRVDVEAEIIEAKKHKDPDEAIAITDVDPRYFDELAGRVVKERFSLRQYVQDIRDVFKTRLLAGQEMDDCIRIEQQFDEEQKRLERIKKDLLWRTSTREQCKMIPLELSRHYRRYVSGFEEFLSKDHERSMEVLDKAEKEAKLTKEISETRNELSKDFGQVRLDVYFWEESWRMVKMCQRFLYQVSPMTWREQHDWIHRSETGGKLLSGSSEDLFGRYRTTDELASLETLIELFEADIANAGKPEIYFEDPFDLIRVFRTMETQNLNALMHLETLAAPISQMKSTIVVAEERMKSEVDELLSAINDYEDSIKKTEARAAALEEQANDLLRGIVRDLVCSEEVLCLRVFIEDTYESCIGPNDANLDSFSMMKWIEKTNEELNLELDTMPQEVVQACEKEGFRQEIKAMRETEEAAKKFELMHRLLDALKRIMEPPVTKGRQLMWRSTPTVEKAKAIPPPPEPTEEEMQYLTFFTDYCKQNDFTAYRSQFPDDFDLTFEPLRRQDVQILSDAEDTESFRS